MADVTEDRAAELLEWAKPLHGADIGLHGFPDVEKRLAQLLDVALDQLETLLASTDPRKRAQGIRLAVKMARRKWL